MKKLKKTLCLFLVLVMCLGLVNIGALAATFDDLQAAINGTADQKPAESSESAESGSSGETTEPSGTVGESPEASDPHANGTRFDYTDKDGNVSDRYGYGWNADTNGWGIHAWNSTTTNEDGTTTTNRNVQLQEDVKGDSDPEGSLNPSGITVGADKDVTIDLNGNDIDGSDRYKDKDGNPVSSTTPQDATINVEDGGDLTLKNSAKNEGKVIGSDKHNVVTVKGEGSELTLENGVNITHDAGNKLENMPAANPVVPADGDDKTDPPAGQGSAANGDDKADTPADPAPAANDGGKTETPETSETKKPTFTTGNNPDGTKDEKPTTGRGVEVSDGGKLTMNGGKITDNNVGGGIDEKPDDYDGNFAKYPNGTYVLDENGVEVKKEAGNFEGKVGGGVFVHDGGQFEMKGGEISHNAAAEGGGIFVGTDTDDANKDSSSFQMKGGKVDGNVAKSGEGGGIYIRSSGGTAGNTITGGDITGNATFTEKDLGGGGIYIESQGGKLNITNLVLTGNVANGLGGGLAGCVHGQTMINIADGSIIYGNTANGNTQTKGHNTFSVGVDGTNGWNIDGHATQNGQPVWNGQENANWEGAAEDTKLKDYAQDVFSAGNGDKGGGIYIPTEMLNGIKPGWTGFVYKDGKQEQIKLNPDGQVVVTGSNVMGLTSNLTADDLKLVQNFLAKVSSQNRVLVSGNYSNVHGGGIGNNGELTIGTKSDEVKGTGVVVEIPTHKNVVNKDQKDDLGTFGYVDGNDQFTMNGGEFTFELVDTKGNVVFENTNNKDGNVAIRIPSNLFDKGEGEYTFTLREKKGENGKIEYDGTEYQIVVVVTEVADTSVGKDGVFQIGDNTIKVWKLNATTTVKTKDKDGNWVDAGNSKENPAEFTNTYTQDIFAEVYVEKKWDDNDNPDRPTSVTVELYKNGQPTGQYVTLSAENEWKATLNGLQHLDENDKEIEWTFKELDVDGYTADYKQDGKLVTVINKKEPENPGPGPGPGPDPDPDPEPTDIPDEEPPLVDIPDEETPTTDIPDEEPPLVEIPDEEPPLVDIPDEEPPLVEIPDEEPPLVDMPPETDIPDVDVPLADVPQTGDYSLVWCAVAVVSVLGLAVLTLKKREDEEA